MKIVLPKYKIIYSLISVIFLFLVRGVANTEEIGSVLEQMMPVLTIVFMGESYWMEYRDNREGIFSLYNLKLKKRMINRRVWIQVLYLNLVAALGYGLYFLQIENKRTFIVDVKEFVIYFLASLITIYFFGVLAILVTNLCNSMWAGIGIVIVFWLFLSSKFGYDILGNFNILAYSFRKIESNDYHWVLGKLVAFILGIVILHLLVPVSVKKMGGQEHVVSGR